MSFLKRLSRSRGNSHSYIDDDFDHSPVEAHSSPPNQRAPSSYHSPGGAPRYSEDDPLSSPTSATLDAKDQDKMYGNRPADNRHSSPIQSSGYAANATRPLQPSGARGPDIRNSARIDSSATRDSGYAGDTPMSGTGRIDSAGGVGGMGGMGGMSTMKNDSFAHAMPDALTRAFNESVRPYQEKIEQLEQQVAEMQDWVESAQQLRMEIFNWIDKRGLRPDVPPAIAAEMDKESADGAAVLNGQLDRKITIVNFDLHRLQDDLNDSISSGHFAAAMYKFVPDIHRLLGMPGGSRYAYELIIKLVGNLNSHGGLESTSAAANDAAAQEAMELDKQDRTYFYQRMDNELLEVVKKRLDEHDDWGKGGLPGEIRRLDRNSLYLKSHGIDQYFPQSIELMKRSSPAAATGGAGAGAPMGPGAGRGAGQPMPPAYHH